MFQRPERASFISTDLPEAVILVSKIVPFQRPERASLISTKNTVVGE